MLGVAILIIVMSVMNGFKTELTNKLLGLNPHIVIQPNGFNIDDNPIYPASLDLDNIITVTSSDQTGRLGRGSNYGRYSVDFILPAERVEVIDHRGVRASTGGTSYAVPRLVALVSRYLNKNPNSFKDDILSFLKKNPFFIE